MDTRLLLPESLRGGRRQRPDSARAVGLNAAGKPVVRVPSGAGAAASCGHEGEQDEHQSRPHDALLSQGDIAPSVSDVALEWVEFT
jgi:hypothetical protein